MRGTIGGLLLIISLLAGLSLSGISVYEHLLFEAGIEDGGVICDATSEDPVFNCGAVSKSAFSEVLGIPLGSYGMAFYSLMLLFAWIGFSERDNEELRSRVFASATLLATLSLLASIFLFLVSKFHIGALCKTCTYLYAASAGTFFGLLLLVPVGFFATLALGVRSLMGTLLGIIKCSSFSCSKRSAAGGIMLTLMMLVSFSIPFVVKVKPPAPSNVESKGTHADESEKLAELARRYEEAALQQRVTGPENAALTVLEYFDYQCPACRVMHELLEEIKQDHPGKIRVIFRHYPLDNACNPAIPGEFHQHACFLARLVECGGQQGRFYDAHSVVMTSFMVEEEGVSREELSEFLYKELELLGFDTQTLKTCVAGEDSLKRVQFDIESGDLLGLKGTPTLWLNGQRITNLRRTDLMVAVQDAISEASHAQN